MRKHLLSRRHFLFRAGGGVLAAGLGAGGLFCRASHKTLHVRGIVAHALAGALSKGN